MSTRREFIQVGLAATAAVAVHSLSMAAASASMQTASIPNGAFYKVIYDSAFPAAIAFAAEAQRLGATTHAIRGDVTDLWYHDLSRRWAHMPTPIAGMTTYQSMFVLALMARDARMHLTYQATHESASDGTAEHSCYGPVAFLSRHPLPETQRTDVWARAAAGIVLQWQTEPIEIEGGTTITAACERSIGAHTLLSWIIAPVPTAYPTDYRSARRSLLNGSSG